MGGRCITLKNRKLDFKTVDYTREEIKLMAGQSRLVHLWYVCVVCFSLLYWELVHKFTKEGVKENEQTV
jgi:hypothetical protein